MTEPYKGYHLCQTCRLRLLKGEEYDKDGNVTRWCKKVYLGNEIKQTRDCQFYRKGDL